MVSEFPERTGVGLPLPTPYGRSRSDDLADLQLTPFATDCGPLQLISDDNHSPWKCLWLVPITGIIFATASWLEASLAPFNFDRTLRDIGTVIDASQSAPTIPDFPLLRDAISLVIGASLSLCLPQLVKQWRVMASIWCDLVGSGVVVLKDVDHAGTLIQRCNQRFSRVGRYGVRYLCDRSGHLIAAGCRSEGIRVLRHIWAVRRFGQFDNEPGRGSVGSVC